MNKNLNCVIIGSFRKFYFDILHIAERLNYLGISVLSPKKSKIIDPSREFVVLESDIETSELPCIHCIEGKVLEHIRTSDFIYMYNPQGYIGRSTAFEVGFAYAFGKKIISAHPVSDPAIAEFVDHIISPKNLDKLTSVKDVHSPSKESD